MAKITNIRVVKAYRFDSDCGHQIHRVYKQCVPKALTIDCPQCLKAEEPDDELEADEEPSFFDKLRFYSFIAAGFVAALTAFALGWSSFQHHRNPAAIIFLLIGIVFCISIKRLL